ncbi:MAG: glycosyltransferase [PVC group bacterium]
MIRILYVIDKMVRAGAQRHLWQLISGLDPDRFQPVVCCLLEKGPLGKELEGKGVPVEALALRDIMGPRFARAIGGVSGAIRRHRVSVVHSYLFAANIISPLAGFLTGTTVITSRRDTGFWKKGRHILAHRAVNPLTFRITANSGEVVSYLLRREKASASRIVLVYNGIEPPPGGRAVRPPVPEEKIKIGTLGNIRPVKGLEYLLEAAGRLPVDPPWELHIGGRVLDRRYHDRLQELGRRHRLQGRLTFRGEIVDPDSFLREMHIFVLPSLAEGFSNALLEAMAAGRAVIATTVGANPEVIDNGGNGFLVPPGDPAALTARLAELLGSPALLPVLGKAACRRVTRDFTVSRMCRKVEELYSLAAGRPAGWAGDTISHGKG